MKHRGCVLAGTVLLTLFCLLDVGCSPARQPERHGPSTTATVPADRGPVHTEAATTPNPSIPTQPASLAVRASVPVLCYHQIRDWRRGESRISRGLTTPPALFAAQMSVLADEGWHVVSIGDYYEHVVNATPLPPKPIVLTFDDGNETQMTALPVLQEHRFTATFFLMTVVIGKRHWISAAQIRTLDALGYTIGAHTYDHPNLAKLPADRVDDQISPPRRVLERIVGHRITFFAYPYGAWNEGVLERVNRQGFDAAFQLSDRRIDAKYPLLTMRRQIVNPFTGISGFRNQISAPVDTTTADTTIAPTATSGAPLPALPSTGPPTRRQTPPPMAPTIAKR